jgi:predicted GNAT family acetyltransferase
MENYELIDNAEESRYEFHIRKYVPVIEYIKNDNKDIYLVHTEVPVELEGKGIAGKLVEAVLNDIEKKGLRLIPLCPFAVSYIKRHPEWNRIVNK